MKMLFLAPVLACSLAFGADVIAKDANITLDGKMIGKIEVLTPVEVLEKGDKTSKIKVSGVVSANYLAQLQRSVEDPEVFVAFDNESEANFKKVKDLEDELEVSIKEETKVIEENFNITDSMFFKHSKLDTKLVKVLVDIYYMTDLNARDRAMELLVQESDHYDEESKKMFLTL